MALLDDNGELVQFLSYGGDFTVNFGASGDPADDVSSTDIGVSETATEPAGQSLQLIDDTWTGPATSSFGSLNDAPRSSILPSTLGSSTR